MSLELWLAFVAAASVLLVIPGPTLLTMISYSGGRHPGALGQASRMKATHPVQAVAR